MKRLPPAIIDFHVHLFPDKGFDAIWKYFAVMGAEVLHKLYSGPCIDYLRAHGVKRIVYSNYAHKAGIAAPMNDWNIDLLARHDRLYCFAAFHPDDDHGLEDAARMLDHPRVMGIKLHFQVQKIYPHDPRLFPLYELVMEKKKRLLLHVGNGPTTNPFVGLEQFLPVLGRYPDLPANIPHMGCYEFQAFMALLDTYPHLYLDTAYTFWPETPFSFNLDTACLEKYKDRILYGSDFPNVILPRQGEIDHLLSLDLSQEFYDRVFYANGMALLHETCP